MHDGKAIVLPGEIGLHQFDAWIGDERRALVNGEPDAPALRKQSFGYVGADEAGAAGDEGKAALKKHRRLLSRSLRHARLAATWSVRTSADC